MSLMQLVNHVYFSPDGQWLASASFDKSVKLWNGITGKFVTSFRGHVGPVYQIRFSFFNPVIIAVLTLMLHPIVTQICFFVAGLPTADFYSAEVRTQH